MDTKQKNTSVEIKPTKSKIKIHTFKEEFMDTPVLIHIMEMNECLWIWVGKVPPKMSQLCVSMPSKYVSN